MAVNGSPAENGSGHLSFSPCTTDVHLSPLSLGEVFEKETRLQNRNTAVKKKRATADSWEEAQVLCLGTKEDLMRSNVL